MKTSSIILLSIVAVLGLPITVMGYLVVFGHSFSADQFNAAGGLVCGSVVLLFIVLCTEVIKWQTH